MLTLHGLVRLSSSHYILSLQCALPERDWAGVVLNRRGCSREPNRLPCSYHSGINDDLTEMAAHPHTGRLQALLCAVGYSLGSSILLKYLGEVTGGCPLPSGVVILVPFRLDECTDCIGPGLPRVYQAHFVETMLAYVQGKQRLFGEQGQMEGLIILQRLGPLEGIHTF